MDTNTFNVNPNPIPQMPVKRSPMWIIVTLVIILLVVAAVYFYTQKRSGPEVIDDSTANTAQNEPSTSDLEQEAADMDLSEIEADFGAEVNSSLQ